MNYAKEQKDKGESFKGTNAVKYIRNDSAALLPSLAEQIEEFMGANVLPAYSMTESNPISSNPRYGERKLKSVGPTVGPDLVVKQGYPDESDIPDGSEGEVCVRGACVMKGYEMRPHMDADPNIETFTKDGFMRSGDKGWKDKDGYLYLIGRFKELINRAGEKISPFEVEDAVRKHDAVKDVLCFSCAHEMLGEAVGVVVVLKEGKSLKLFDLNKWCTNNNILSEKWCPEVMVTMPDLPKGATGKPARINLAKRLELKPLTGLRVELEHPGL
jgi:acyl-CoA synthetase (AMP-forming)/AMP-acid ligase II